MDGWGIFFVVTDTQAAGAGLGLKAGADLGTQEPCKTERSMVGYCTVF